MALADENAKEAGFRVYQNAVSFMLNLKSFQIKKSGEQEKDEYKALILMECCSERNSLKTDCCC